MPIILTVFIGFILVPCSLFVNPFLTSFFQIIHFESSSGTLTLLFASSYTHMRPALGFRQKFKKVMRYMHKNRYYFCKCDCEQEDVLDAIERGICRIKEGIKDVKIGLDLICCCRIQEGIKCIEKGLCKLEKGLDEVVEGLRDVEFECDYRSNMNIVEGICDLKDGVRGVREGLCQLKKCCLCEGLESIQCALHDLDEGLCKLVKGVAEIRDERDMRRKKKFCK
jgi:hypothetical protein